MRANVGGRPRKNADAIAGTQGGTTSNRAVPGARIRRKELNAREKLYIAEEVEKAEVEIPEAGPRKVYLLKKFPQVAERQLPRKKGGRP